MGRKKNKRVPSAEDLSPEEAIRASYPTDPMWNRRYLEYARHEGMTSPDAMLLRDQVRYPGGRMAGFILWVGARRSEWQRSIGKTQNDFISSEEEVAFDAWLKAYVDKKTALIIQAKVEIARPRGGT